MKYFGQQMLFLPGAQASGTTAKLMEFVWDDVTNQLNVMPVSEAQALKNQLHDEADEREPV